MWNGGRNGAAGKLASSYRSGLETAETKGLKSIAFCAISTGVYRYPLELATPIALSTVWEHLDAHPDTSLKRVVFAMFQPAVYTAFRKAWEAMLETVADK